MSHLSALITAALGKAQDGEVNRSLNVSCLLCNGIILQAALRNHESALYTGKEPSTCWPLVLFFLLSLHLASPIRVCQALPQDSTSQSTGCAHSRLPAQ